MHPLHTTVNDQLQSDAFTLTSARTAGNSSSLRGAAKALQTGNFRANGIPTRWMLPSTDGDDGVLTDEASRSKCDNLFL